MPANDVLCMQIISACNVKDLMNVVVHFTRY